MQIPVLLDRSRREPLTSQLVDQLRDAIRHARIRPGTRLPSSRRLSEQLSVSRNTVIRAYDALIVEGYVESRPASGIFVSDSLPGTPVKVTASAQEPARVGTLSHMPMPPLPLRVPNVVDPQRNRLSVDFFPGRPSAALFPVKTWRRLLQSNLSHGGSIGLSQYGDPAGWPALRSAIADHLATTRGIAADPARIVIISGAQEGISIAARLFLNHGTPSAIEDPCYQGAAFAFEATGSEIASVAVDFEGLIPQELPQRPTALPDVTPSWHGRDATAATFWKTTATATFVMKVRPCRRSRLRRRIARSTWAHFRGRSVPGCGLDIWSFPNSSPGSSPRRKAFSTTAIPGSTRPHSPR
jgi:GntR family transcriptional regulator/MocR family aminotransferase